MKSEDIKTMIDLIGLALIMGFILLSIYGANYLLGDDINYSPEKSDYVECSGYPKILDIWKTPKYYYVKISTLSYPVSISKTQYENWNIGQYIDKTYLNGWDNIELVSVNESESGFRDACLLKEV